MYKYIALLRGINVGGKNKLLMKELKQCLEKAGFLNVQTYIQSGNLVFELKEKQSSKEIAIQIQHTIKNTFDYLLPVHVFHQTDWISLIKNNPFLMENNTLDIKYLHVTFLQDVPSPTLLPKVLKVDTGTEQLKLVEDKLYLYYPDGYGRAKMTNNKIETKLQVTATTRNWKTCQKLYEIITT
jgi:uncharacterized protein (DUF1697 family)